MTKPDSGTVHDGLGTADVDYIVMTDPPTLSATWRGFSDLGSGMSSYLACVGTTPGGQDVVPCVNCGLATFKRFTISSNVEAGTHFHYFYKKTRKRSADNVICLSLFICIERMNDFDILD